MASFTWKGLVSGQWGEDSLWAGAAAPNDALADVSLPAGSYTVSVAAGAAFVARTVNAGAGTKLDLAGGLTLGANTMLSTVVVQPGGRLSSASGIKVDTLDNAGTVSATVPGSFMQLTSGTVTNTGTFAATASGTYLFVNGATLTNLAAGVLSGGTYTATGEAIGGSVAIIDIARPGISTEITTLDATVELRFINSAMYGRSADGGLRTLESTLTTIAPGGVLRVLDGRAYTTTQALAVAGRLELGGGKLNAGGGLSVASGGTIAGFGTIGAALSLAGELAVAGGTLALTGALSGSGTATIAAGATLVLPAGSPGVSITGEGVLRTAAGTLSLGTPLGGAPVVVVASGTTLDLAGAGASTLALSAATARVALNTASFTGRIAGLQTGNVLTLKDIVATGISVAASGQDSGQDSGQASGQDSELTLATAGGSVVLKLVGDYSGKSFALAPAAGGGTEVTVQGVSFAPGLALWDRPTLTWSFAQANYPSAFASFSGFVDPVAQAELAALWRVAFARWAQVSGLTLVEVADTPGATGQADIRVGWDNFGNPPAGQIGNAQSSFTAATKIYFPGTLVRLQDPSVTPLVAGSGGALVYQGTASSIYQVMLHEIGHALGLDHSSAAVDPASAMTPVASETNRDLDLSDIAGIRALYAGLLTDPPATIGIAPLLATRPEGQAGATDFTFTVSRTGDTASGATADFTVAGCGPNPASAADFTGNALPTGTVIFAPAEASRTITFAVAGDTIFEANEGLTVTLANPSGAILGITSANGTIQNDDAPPCFAAGTRVLTARGEVAVETLREGDLVMVHSAAGTRPVRWVGHRHIRVAGHPRPWDVQPVRIHAHAFGPGLPNRDLRLSPDHAVYSEGVLIPVRYLVNGATIVQETVKEITYYHVELAGSDGAAAHDVLFAHGLMAESYLDTGNRAAFANGGRMVTMHPDFSRDAWHGGCAPLVLEGPVIEALRVALLAQATTMGHVLSVDPALHLVADGAAVEGERDGVVYRFALPPHARDVRLVSRSTVPAETRPDSHDTRRLGVAVTRLVLDDIRLSLDDPRLRGGWQVSEGDWRWTSGNAALAIAGRRTLEVTIACLESYWIPTAAVARRTRTVAL